MLYLMHMMVNILMNMFTLMEMFILTNIRMKGNMTMFMLMDVIAGMRNAMATVQMRLQLY